ncbi:hypothetical protein EDD11_008244 [Mortierella claussenii]|nr:hypothetical protein EDD11_008244 [Mortierella claussenii]
MSQPHRDSGWLCGGSTSEGWGPVSPDRTDFTLCFEYSIFYAAFALAALVVFGTRVRYLRTTQQPHNLGRTAWIYWPTQGFMLLASFSMLLQCIDEIWSADAAFSHIIGSFTMGLAWACGMILNYNEHKFSIRSSDSLFVFYVLAIVSCTFILHTQHSLDLQNQTAYHLNILFIVSLTLGFVVEAWPRGSTRVQQRSGAQDYEKANFFSQVSFWSFQPIISLAAKQQILHPADIVNMLPEENKTEHGYTRLSTSWSKDIEQYQDTVQQLKRQGLSAEEIHKQTRPPSLLKTIFISNWRAMLPILLLRIVIPFTEFLSPVILELFLDFIEGPSSTDDLNKSMSSSSFKKPRDQESKPLLYGLALAFAIFASHTIVNGLYGRILKDIYCLGIEIKSSLVSMIYRKALRLSPDARRKSSKGSITNHMSVDAVLWEEGTEVLTNWVSLPFDFGICLFMLYRLLGWSFMAGIITIIALLPLQIWRASVYEGLEEERLQATDERVRLTSEILSNSKIVKLYGWEAAFKRKILCARTAELKVVKRLGVLEAIMSVIFASSSVLISLITFAVYVTLGRGELTPKVVFVSITLFDMLRVPVARLAEGTTDTISLIVGSKRIQRFLLREEIDDTQIIRENRVNSAGRPNDTVVVEILNAVMSWTGVNAAEAGEEDAEEDEETSTLDEHQPMVPEDPMTVSVLKPALQNINLTIHDKSITAVVGRVGQGKSSLLSAIIGDMYKLQGTIRVRGRVAYVPQQAWIINATLRDNIVFGNHFDPARYRKVLQVCGLEPDLAVLPAGDMTEIGERGINLSGGQKQRISLARATYDNADVYLLDDPLSAVDAHVDRLLWEQLIGPEGMLKDKARILVTHGIHHLEHVDQIVVIKEGEIEELGQYEGLMASKRTFYQLITEYSAKHSRKRRNSHAVKTATATEAESGSGLSSDSHGSATGGETPISQMFIEDAPLNSDVDSDNITIEEDVDGVPVKSSDGKHPAVVEEGDDQEEDELIVEEVMKKGGIEWKLIKSYAKACTLPVVFLFLLFNIVAQLCIVGFSLWLKHWISKSKEELQESLVLFLGVYGGISLVYVLFYVQLVYLALAVGRIRASERIHWNLISTVIRLPMSFFDTTPLGRILNRFSSDMYSIDEHLPWKFMDLLYLSISVACTFTVIAFTTPIFIIVIPIIASLFVFIARYFLWATRSLKRIESVSVSPIYQHFDESLNGVSTIRAMNVQSQFIAESDRRTDFNANAYTAYMLANRWVDCRLQMLSVSVSFVVALSAVLGRYTVDPALIGLSLNFAFGVSDSVMWLCRDYSEWQSHLVAIERVQEYTDKHTEAPEHTQRVLPESWPDQGRVIFKNYSTRYREGLDLVIKHLSFEVKPGEKLGIVGRTGAGKSSMTLALFRIIEAANSPWARASDNTGYHQTHEQEREQSEGEHQPLLRGDDDQEEPSMDGGSIEIDGVDISTIGLSDLRRHLAIIPQDPTLFAGTIRDNLDPFQEAPDSDLWEALERAHLKDHIQTLPGGLSAEVSQNGENFSVGQRSLICLARALLRKHSKILILDEATAAVDVETDELIQRTIRKEFCDRTVVTIAHRIKTIMDSTRILVMDQGRVVELESPEVLLRNRESLFFELARQAGEVAA